MAGGRTCVLEVASRPAGEGGGELTVVEIGEGRYCFEQIYPFNENNSLQIE